MPVLHLDYQRAHRSFSRMGCAVLCAAILCLAGVGAWYHDLLDATDALMARQRQLDRAAPDRALGMRQLGEKRAVMSQDVRQANQVLRELSVPWEALFRAVEASGGKDVTLLSIEPDQDKHVTKILGEAKDVSALLNYMRQLGRQPVLRNVYLQHHQIQRQDADKPVRFAIVASWEPQS
jgi:Tfp pilus assembly protein PilN